MDSNLGNIEKETRNFQFSLDEYECEYLEKFQTILKSKYENSNCNFKVFLAPEALRIKALVGKRSDGATWRFNVWGPNVGIESEPAKTWFSQKHLYNVQNFYFWMDHLNFFKQEVVCACGKRRVEVGICLKEELCSLIRDYFYRNKQQPHKFFLEEIIEMLRSEIAQYKAERVIH